MAEQEIDLLPVGRLTRGTPRVVEGSAGKSYSYSLLSSWDPFREISGPNTTVQEFFSARSLPTNTRKQPLIVLAAIDQFEELFTAFPARHEESERLIDELAGAVQGNESLRLLLIIRDDHLVTLNHYKGRLSPYPLEYRHLEALDTTAAIEAVTGPLAGTGRSFAPAVAENFVETLQVFSYTNRLLQKVTIRRNEVEPFDLQIACARLWSALPDDVEVITGDEMRAFGDPNQAAADFFDSVISDICHRMQLSRVSEVDLREWVESTFITEWGTRSIILRGITMTADMPNNVSDALADLGILTPEYHNLSTWYQLSADRLIEAVRRANSTWRSNRGVVEAEPSQARMAGEFRAEAEALLSAGDLAGAQQLIARAVDSYSNAEDKRRLAHTLELQGKIARAKGDLNAAEQIFHRALYQFSILEDITSQVRLLSALGDIYSSQGDYAKAVQYHQDAIQRLPADVHALTGLGYAQWYWGSPADAEATFTRALGWNHNEGQALAGRGQVRVELHEYPAALADLDRAITLGLPLDNEIDARSARAVIFADLGREDEADRELRAARYQDPDRPRTRLRAGRVAAALGHTKQARHELEHALQAEPPLPPTDREIALRLLGRLRDDA
jgi:tetratricopeptide (TPR) repeat protein